MTVLLILASSQLGDCRIREFCRKEFMSVCDIYIYVNCVDYQLGGLTF